jgi:hypothetical protein
MLLFVVIFGGGFNSIISLCFARLRGFLFTLKFCVRLLFGEKPLLVVMRSMDIHALGSPFGVTGSAQLAPLHVITFVLVLAGVGGLDQHPGTIFLRLTTTATAPSTTVSVASTSTSTALVPTSAPATTITGWLEFVKLQLGFVEGSSQHGDFMLSRHQVGPGSCGLFWLVNRLEGLEDFFHGHGPFVVVGAGRDKLVTKHIIIVVRHFVKE